MRSIIKSLKEGASKSSAAKQQSAAAAATVTSSKNSAKKTVDAENQVKSTTGSGSNECSSSSSQNQQPPEKELMQNDSASHVEAIKTVSSESTSETRPLEEETAAATSSDPLIKSEGAAAAAAETGTGTSGTDAAGQEAGSISQSHTSAAAESGEKDSPIADSGAASEHSAHSVTLSSPQLTPPKSGSPDAGCKDPVGEKAVPSAADKMTDQPVPSDEKTAAESVPTGSSSSDDKDGESGQCNTESGTTAYSQQLERQGLQSPIANRLSQLFSSGKLSPTDLDDRAIDALKEYGSMDAVLLILDEFENANLEHVNNKSAFLCGLMKTHRQKEKAMKHKALSCDNNSSIAKGDGIISANGFINIPAATACHTGSGDAPDSLTSGLTVAPGPNEANLKAILQRTGYTLDVTSGQRKYGGPPPDWNDPPPGPGCEIFVGKIPKELFEEELIPLFEEVGRIWDLRLMIDPVNGFNRGFAFITYCTKEDATNAQMRVSDCQFSHFSYTRTAHFLS